MLQSPLAERWRVLIPYCRKTPHALEGEQADRQPDVCIYLRSTSYVMDMVVY